MKSAGWSRGPLSILLLLLLAAPSQGAVGSCSDKTDPLSAPADVVAYCDEREQLLCVRRFERGELLLSETNDCRRKAIAVCQTREFLPGCVPTERQARACLDALHSRSTLDLGVDEIEECKGFCHLDVNDSIDGGMP